MESSKTSTNHDLVVLRFSQRNDMLRRLKEAESASRELAKRRKSFAAGSGVARSPCTPARCALQNGEVSGNLPFIFCKYVIRICTVRIVFNAYLRR
jgi:hypothetical protein